jgi:hypothetical protein
MPDEGIRLIHLSGEREIDLARREPRVPGSSLPAGRLTFEIVEGFARSAASLSPTTS